MDILAATVCAAADAAGMRARRYKRGAAWAHAPYYDVECVQLKAWACRAPPALRRACERRYHSLVRSKARIYKRALLFSLIRDKSIHNRDCWKRFKGVGARLPTCLRSVGPWGAFMARVADIGGGNNVSLPLEAYPVHPMAGPESALY
jgi:hypothetical protein